MTVQEVIDSLRRKVQLGHLSSDSEVMVRNPYVSDEAMEAGSDGYETLEEIRVITLADESQVQLVGAEY